MKFISYGNAMVYISNKFTKKYEKGDFWPNENIFEKSNSPAFSDCNFLST